VFDGHINKSNHHNTTVWKVLKMQYWHFSTPNRKLSV